LRSLRLKEGDERELLADIAAMDRVLVNVLGYTGDIAEASRDFRREALFGRGELARAVMGVLRQANGPLTARQIAGHALATKGKALEPGRLGREWVKRVRVVCQKLPDVELAMVDGLQVWQQRQRPVLNRSLHDHKSVVI